MAGDQLREFAAEPGEPEGPGPAGEGASAPSSLEVEVGVRTAR